MGDNWKLPREEARHISGIRILLPNNLDLVWYLLYVTRMKIIPTYLRNSTFLKRNVATSMRILSCDPYCSAKYVLLCSFIWQFRPFICNPAIRVGTNYNYIVLQYLAFHTQSYAVFFFFPYRDKWNWTKY